MTIAIDGPVGAGKSTIAQGVADALGVLHLDTGAMYRAMGLKALRAGIDPKDAAAAEALCAETDISVEMGANGQKTLLDGEDVSSLIRTAEVSAAASDVSTVKAVLPALSASMAENSPANSAKQTSKTKYAAARISSARNSFKSSCVSPPENRRSSRSTTQPASSAKMSHCQARRGNSASADVLQ